MPIRYTDKEKMFIRGNYCYMSHSKIAKKIGRTTSGISLWCGRNGCRLTSVKKFTIREKRFIKKNYYNLTHEKMANILGRPVNSVSIWCSQNKLIKRPMKKFQDWECDFIMSNYWVMLYKDIAKFLKRTPKSIIGFCHRRGLKCRIPISNYEKKIIKYYYNKNKGKELNQKKLAHRLSRSGNYISTIASSMGLTNRFRKRSVEFKKKRALWMLKQLKKHSQSCIFHKHKHKKNVIFAFYHCKHGHFDINGKSMFFRSQWEANYARYLDWLKSLNKIISWHYEPDHFWFDKVKKGIRCYTPDFRIKNRNLSIFYHEVKGWMDDKSRSKINRMKFYYPDIKLVIIDNKKYKMIEKKFSKFIPGWNNGVEVNKKRAV